jgi:hypothetical protein
MTFPPTKRGSVVLFDMSSNLEQFGVAMPIAEADPWRVQYFNGVDCPDNVMIPTEDADAYVWFPRHKWLYNKLQVAECQGICCGPHGLEPRLYPVFSKPIYNMRGMGAGSEVFRSRDEYTHGQKPGYMWMELLEGEHVSTDIAVVNGEARWWRHAVGVSIGEGMFDYWAVEATRRPALEARLGRWLEARVSDYTGMINLETIGGRIIEGHLRFSDQWPDLYGPGWVESLIALYRDGEWSFVDANRRVGFSVALFGPHGVIHKHPPIAAVDELRTWRGISSIQITFHENRPAAAHSMPPGGFRLAIVNCADLALGRAVRDRLASLFGLDDATGRRIAAAA